MCLKTNSALQISHLNTVFLSPTVPLMTISTLEKRKRVYYTHFCRVLFLLLFISHNKVFGSSWLLIQSHLQRSISGIHAISCFCCSSSNSSTHTHTHARVYMYMCMYMKICVYVSICTYIYVEFHTRISYSIKKGTSQSFQHGNRNETDSSSGQDRNKVSAWGHWHPLDTPTLSSCA